MYVEGEVAERDRDCVDHWEVPEQQADREDERLQSPQFLQLRKPRLLPRFRGSPTRTRTRCWPR